MKVDKSFDVANTFGLLGGHWYGANGLGFGSANISLPQNFRYPAALELGWTFKGINIYNCSVGIDVSAATSGKQEVGSVTSIDSSITNIPIGVLTAHSSTSQPATGGSLILETVTPSNIP
ncbi:hypothetical protein V8E51_018506 [Hyaloscypha variabilis]